MPAHNLTDDELFEAVDAVISAGGTTPAARLLKVSDSTVRRRCQEARERGILDAKAMRQLAEARLRHSGQADPPLTQSSQQASELRQELRAERKRREQAEATIKQMRQARAPAVRPKHQRPKKGDRVRLVLSDVHGSHMDPKAIGALLGDLDVFGSLVDEVVLNGDIVDCGGFLSAHHTLGYVAQIDENCWEDDVAAGGIVQHHVAVGTPDRHRIANVDVGEQLGGQAAPGHPLDGELQRGLAWRGDHHMGLGAPGVIRLGDCLYTHGELSNKHTASKMLDEYGMSVCFAHTHRADSYFKRPVMGGTIGAWNFGCLCVLQPRYQHSKPSGWTHGYGIQLVQEGGAFTTIHVPIVKGRSLAAPLFGRIGG